MVILPLITNDDEGRAFDFAAVYEALAVKAANAALRRAGFPEYLLYPERAEAETAPLERRRAELCGIGR